MECFKCGKSSDELFEAICSEGIKKICPECISRHSLIIVRCPTEEQIKSINKKVPLKEKLAKMAGIGGFEDTSKYLSKDKRELINKQDVTLKDIMDKKYIPGSLKKNNPSNLVDNFHWIIMRARRSKKISHAQLAEVLFESEEALKNLEKGVLAVDSMKLIKKLEDYLCVNLFKQNEADKLRKKTSDDLKFDRFGSKAITIEELKELNSDESTKVKSSYYWRDHFKRKEQEEESSQWEEVKTVKMEDDDIVQETDFILDPVEESAEEKYPELEMLEEKPVEEPKEEEKTEVPEIKEENSTYAGKKELSQEEINSILFGRSK